MRNIFAVIAVILLFSCEKKKHSEEFVANEYVPVQYDTTAIDSFSQGAISVDVAERIRQSSIAYQDSVRKVRIQQEEERKAREEEAKKAAEEKKKQEEQEKLLQNANSSTN